MPGMPNVAHFEPIAWWWTRKQIGRNLKEHYDVPKELPPKLANLILQVDAVEENRLLRFSGATSDREQMVEARIIAGANAFPDWFVLT